MLNKTFAALCLGLGLSISAAAAELVHNPVLSAAAGQEVEINANLVGAEGDPRVRLFFRPKGKEIFRSVEMGGNASDLRATIPGSAIDVAGIEYYLEASLIKNSKKTVLATSPAANPTLNPHQIVVRKDETGPEVTPLSPADGETLDTARTVITASFGDPDSGVDSKSVLIKIDGEVVRDSDIQAFDTMVSYVLPKDLSDGEHEFVVVVKDMAGNAGSAKWKVTVKASTGQKSEDSKAKGWLWDGRLGAETQYGHSLNQSNPNGSLPYRPYGYNKGTLEVNGRGADDTVQVKITKTDAERSDQQPADRYVAKLKNRQGEIALGDSSPNFSELSLYNLYQLRGITLDLRSGPLTEGHTRMVGVWGQTRRAIESGSTGLAGGSTNATFAQYLYGARWEFGSPYFQMGLNSVTVNDDKGSIKAPGSTLSRYNTITTSDLKIGLPFMFLTLNGETGFDIYSDPTPIFGTSVGSAYKAGLDWNIKPWSSRLTFDFKDLGGNFGLLPGGYTTVANPGLVPDYRGYESSFSQGLFDGQFSLDLNLNRWKDNLQGVKLATTTSDYLSVFSNIAPEGYPYLNLGYTQNLQANDADGNTTTGNFITNNKSTTMNLTLGYSKAFDEKTTGNLSLSYVKQDYKDESSQRLTQDLNGNNVVLSAFASLGLSSFNASVGFGGNEQPGFTNTALTFTAQPSTTRNVNTSLRWSQQWQRSVLDSYLGWDLSNGSTEKAAYGAFVKGNSTANRNTFSLGGGWAFAPRQRLGAGFSLAMLSTSSEAAGVKVSDELTQLYSNLKYDLTF